MHKSYNEAIDVANNLIDVALSKRESFFQQLLIVSSTLLGIVISLHTTNSPHLCIRLVFVAALVLLALGVLATVFVVFDFLQIRHQSRQVYLTELNTASQNNRPVGYVQVEAKKRTAFLEKSSLLFFVSGLIVLTSYAVLINLF